MIVLDTNVVSELMKPRPDRTVVAWVGQQPASTQYTTSITQAEILYGVQRLPSGHRRDRIHAAAVEMLETDFARRVLAFDGDAAAAYALIAADRDRAGKPISQSDAQIAAIAKACGAVVATRNVGDFHGCGVKVVDPWAP